MRILVVVHGFPPNAQGGSEIYANAHAQALRRGFDDEILVITRECDPSGAEYAVREEILDGVRVARINNTFRDARTFDDTYRNDTIDAIADGIIGRFRPDAAHIHHLTCLSTGIVRQLAKRHIPTYLTLHDFWLICHRGQLLDVDFQVCENATCKHAAMCSACVDPVTAGTSGMSGSRLLRTIARRTPAATGTLLRAATKVATLLASDSGRSAHAARRTSHMRSVCADVTGFFAPSQYIRDRFVAFGIDRDRIVLGDYGFDHEPFRRLARTPSERLRIGFLGSLMISKAPHVLLESIDSLAPGSFTVTLYGSHVAYHGDDSYRARLARLLERPDVRVHGPLPHSLVPQALSALDVLVVPSIWPENSPLVIHEAFLAGVPVVTSNIGGIPELVADGVNGLLFEPGDPDDLARVLDRLIREPGLLDHLRAGIPSVRSIEDDVRCARQVYAIASPMA